MGDETMRRTVKSVTGRSLLVALAAAWVGAAPPPAWSTEGPTSSQIERAMRATVGILQHAQESPSPAQGARFSVRGSGFHLRDGYIVTARHAVKRRKGGRIIIPKTITVRTRDLEELPAALIGVNAFVDLAVYRISLGSGVESLTSLSFSPREPESGEQTFTIGYPLRWGPVVAFGRVGNSNIYLPTARSRLFQIDLSSCSGNSGGGVFNAQGEIVGMIQAIIPTETAQEERRCSRFAFAVPGHLIQKITSALIAGKQPGFSKLGLELSHVKMGSRWRTAVSKATGPAREGGIRKGDVLLTIEDTPITDSAQLKTYLIEQTVPGQRVAIQVRRGETEHLLYVTLGSS